MKMLRFVISFALCLLLFHVTSTIDAQCNVSQFHVQQNFSINKYLGKWYELSWRPPSNIPKQLRFVDYENILRKGKNGNITVTMKYRIGSSKSTCQTAKGTLFPGIQPAKLKFADPVVNSTVKISDYWVLSTDYVSYSVVYYCGTVLQNGTCDPTTVDAAVWGREKTALSNSLNTSITNTLQNVCITSNTMIPTDHSHECDSSGGVRVHGYFIYLASVIFLTKFFL